MSITRLQQARQMYALGQLVSKTMDGSRPGYRGDRGYQGGATNQGGAGNPGSGSGNGNKGSDRPETTRHNPHTDTGTSKTTTVTGDEMKSAHRDFIQTLNTNNAIRAAQTGEKFKPFDSFAPTSFLPQQNKFGLLDLALLAASGGLFGAKIATGAKMFNTAKRAKNLFDTVTSTYDIKNPFKDVDVKTSISEIFKDNKPSKSTTNNTTIKDSSSDREGIATLDNQAGNYDEYILLLQKLQSGNISDAERNRYNVLKNMLGV